MLAALVVYPLIHTIELSLRNFRTGEFVGLHNFARAFQDALFLASLEVTAVYVVAALAGKVVLGLSLALLVHRIIRGAVARTLIYLLFIIPIVTPTVVAGVIVRLIYTPTYGMLNVFLFRLGLIQRDVLWLSGAGTAMLAVLSVDIWQWTPFVFLVCFALAWSEFTFAFILVSL